MNQVVGESEGTMGSDEQDSDDDAGPEDGVTGLLERATELKTKGNAAFKAGDTGAATTAYTSGIERLTSDAAKKALGEWWKANPGTADLASPLLASLHTNLAACHVKAEQWEGALTAATAALAIDATNVKARFRRGVACSRLGRLDEAKAELTTVARADPKNREARTVLEVVVAGLKAQASSERAMFAKTFAGPSLYADEEARSAKAAAAAAEAKAAAEAALLKEWRAECDELRKGGPADKTAELLAEAANCGDVEARVALDKLAPISLKEYGEAKLRAAAKEKKREEEAEAKRREAARAARGVSDVSVLEAEDDNEAELLKGLKRGYKTRADGSKTSYFDRTDSLDPAMKALLEAQKQPKRIDGLPPEPSAPSGGTGALPLPTAQGSVWNTGTWEERDVSVWAHAELSSRLMATSLPPLRVSEISGIEGHASIISNRGKVKRPFELKCDLAWEMELPGGHSCDGVLSYTEIAPAPSGSAAAVTYERTARFKTAPAEAEAPPVGLALLELQARVDAAFKEMVDELATK